METESIPAPVRWLTRLPSENLSTGGAVVSLLLEGELLLVAAWHGIWRFTLGGVSQGVQRIDGFPGAMAIAGARHLVTRGAEVVDFAGAQPRVVLRVPQELKRQSFAEGLALHGERLVVGDSSGGVSVWGAEARPLWAARHKADGYVRGLVPDAEGLTALGTVARRYDWKGKELKSVKTGQCWSAVGGAGFVLAVVQDDDSRLIRLTPEGQKQVLLTQPRLTACCIGEGGDLYAGGQGTVTCLDPAGRPRWAMALGCGGIADLVERGGCLYVGTRRAEVLAVDVGQQALAQARAGVLPARVERFAAPE